MTTAEMNGNGTPVTRSELVEELARFRTELTAERRAELVEQFTRFKAELQTEVHGDIAEAMNYVVERLSAQMHALRDEWRTEMVAMRDDLSYQIANAARVAAEEHRRELGVVDEKYQDLPGRVGLLERELDEHRRNPAAHARPPRRRPRS